jgi:hypothetical protein
MWIARWDGRASSPRWTGPQTADLIQKKIVALCAVIAAQKGNG